MSGLITSPEERIHLFLARPDYVPLRQHELAKAMGLKGPERADLRRALRDMERAGRVVRLRKNRWALPRAGREILGALHVHPDGYGFVIPDTPGEGDIYVPANALGTALHDDRVQVLITTTRAQRTGQRGEPSATLRREGRITRVVERVTTDVVGHLLRTPYYWYVVPDNPRVLQDVRVREFASEVPEPHEHYKVTVRLDPWNDPARPLSGVVTEELGPAGSPEVDMLCVIRDHHLETDFSDAAESEAAGHPPTPPAAALEDRRDLREVLTFTIDPWNARDYDDAVSLAREADGRWRLGIHIADVAHYVTEGSALDRDAYLRGNSVYLVDRVLPMLPRHLTTDVCSLQPQQDRLTHSVSLLLDADGEVVAPETCPSVIRSAARLTYEQVQQFLDTGEAPDIPSPVRDVLLDMRALARRLRERRVAHGSLDFNLPEVECVLDEHGRPVRLVKRAAREAYQLIEEFMLLANRTVADILADRSLPAIYRVHGPPGEEQWMQMAADLEMFGLDEAPSTPEELNRVARSVAGTPLEYPVQLSILRNLKRAEYSSRLDGHFGLAFDRYTHFTSPIRRYPDLVVHRILRAAEERRRSPYGHDDIARVAAHCSETEREADDAEQESVDIKRIQFYEDRLWKGDTGPFDGLVVSIVPRGLIVELTDTLQRGLVPFSSLDDDYYVINKARNRAVGRRYKQTWTMGTPVSVMLVKVDTARRFVDFRFAEPPARKAKKEGRGATRRHRMR